MDPAMGRFDQEDQRYVEERQKCGPDTVGDAAMNVTVDASVFVAQAKEGEPFNAASRECIVRLERPDWQLACPGHSCFLNVPGHWPGRWTTKHSPKPWSNCCGSFRE